MSNSLWDKANRSVSNVSLEHINDKKNQNTQDV